MVGVYRASLSCSQASYGAAHALRILALRRYRQGTSPDRPFPGCRAFAAMSGLPPADELPAPKWARADYPKIPAVAIGASPGPMSRHLGWAWAGPGLGPAAVGESREPSVRRRPVCSHPRLHLRQAGGVKR